MDEIKDEILEEKVEENTLEEVASEPVKVEPIFDDEALVLITDIADKLVCENMPEAFYFSELGAQKNIPECKYLLAICYLNGLGVEKNPTKANELFDAAFNELCDKASDKDWRSSLFVGYYYLNEYGSVAHDDDDAFDYFAQARMLGSLRAQACLFEFANRSTDSKLNRWQRDKAMKLAEKAMEVESEFISSGKEDLEEIDPIKTLEGLCEKNFEYAMSLLAKWYENGLFTEQDINKAIDWYEKVAKTDTNAKLYLANAYENGLGVEKNIETAFSWYLSAAEDKNAIALNKVGDMYYDGRGTEQDYDKSYCYHTEAANLGLSDAKYKLGIHYYNAEGCKKDVKKCLFWNEEAAKDNYDLAEYRLGSCYAGVYGVEKNEKLSQYWFIRAALHGNKDAAEKVGILGEECQIIDFDKAINYLKSSAEKGNDDSLYLLGRVYEQEVETQDLDKALDYYQQAAEKGVVEAYERFGCGKDGKGYAKDSSRFMFWYERSLNGKNPLAKMRLGHCYEIGNGTEQSNEKALSWYDQSALAGCALAQFMLGNFYHDHNKLVENDDSKAVYYYELAANEEYVPAQMALAECYEKAFGTEKNINKAVYWYQKAAANKNYDAEKKLTKFKKKSDGNWVKKLF